MSLIRDIEYVRKQDKIIENLERKNKELHRRIQAIKTHTQIYCDVFKCDYNREKESGFFCGKKWVNMMGIVSGYPICTSKRERKRLTRVITYHKNTRGNNTK